MPKDQDIRSIIHGYMHDLIGNMSSMDMNITLVQETKKETRDRAIGRLRILNRKIRKDAEYMKKCILALLDYGD